MNKSILPLSLVWLHHLSVYLLRRRGNLSCVWLFNTSCFKCIRVCILPSTFVNRCNLDQQPIYPQLITDTKRNCNKTQDKPQIKNYMRMNFCPAVMLVPFIWSTSVLWSSSTGVFFPLDKQTGMVVTQPFPSHNFRHNRPFTCRTTFATSGLGWCVPGSCGPIGSTLCNQRTLGRSGFPCPRFRDHTGITLKRPGPILSVVRINKRRSVLFTAWACSILCRKFSICRSFTRTGYPAFRQPGTN